MGRGAARHSAAKSSAAACSAAACAAGGDAFSSTASEAESGRLAAVSYTHLDVYKRQRLITLAVVPTPSVTAGSFTHS